MRAVASFTLGVSVILVGCSQSADRPATFESGDALQPNNGAMLGGREFRPGEEWILMLTFLRNTSDGSITLREIEPITPAGHETVDVIRLEIAPLPGTTPDSTDDDVNRNWTGAGLFKTYPPADQYERGAPCQVQALEPVDGFVLSPDGEARVMVWLRAVAEGSFSIDGHRVVYEKAGSLYTQDLVSGQRGRVAAGDRPGLPLAKWARVCVRQGVTEPLPVGTLSGSAS